MKKLFLSLILTLMTQAFALANPIVIKGAYQIDKDTTFDSVQLDLSEGYFEVVNNAKLTLKNSLVSGVLSPQKLHLLHLVKGSIDIQKNRFNVTAKDIPENPSESSLSSVFFITEGQVSINGNHFLVDRPYTSSLLVTNKFYTSGFEIIGNEIDQFHGGFILKNSHHALLAHNQFRRVSTTNILIFKGSYARLEQNLMLFSGNNNIGDGIDLIDADHVQVEGNYIASGSCYSLSILQSKNILLAHNKIVGGITYGIFISGGGLKSYYNAPLLGYLIPGLGDKNESVKNNQNIEIIDNYLSQNRYGLTASDTQGLTVENNLFIQKFSDAGQRRFWTNNKTLLKDVTQLTWTHNWYKEAYAQDDSGTRTPSTVLVEFPASGGVNLE